MKTYDVRTHGCQMNVHDSERLAGLLENAGYVDVSSLPSDTRPETADVVVFNTCAVRENADNKLYGNLGQLRPAKTRNPDMQIAVGGCRAQKDRDTIVEAGAVGRRRVRHEQHRQPAGPARPRPAQPRGTGRDPRVARGVPLHPSHPARLRLQRLGLDLGGVQQHLHVLHRPQPAGQEADRRPGDILAEVQALVDQGVVEITLLGQNVNTYGVEFGDRHAFGKLLRVR